MRMFREALDGHQSRLTKDDGDVREDDPDFDRLHDNADHNVYWIALADCGYQGAQKLVCVLTPKKKLLLATWTGTNIKNSRIKQHRVIVKNWFGKHKSL